MAYGFMSVVMGSAMSTFSTAIEAQHTQVSDFWDCISRTCCHQAIGEESVLVGSATGGINTFSTAIKALHVQVVTAHIVLAGHRASNCRAQGIQTVTLPAKFQRRQHLPRILCP